MNITSRQWGNDRPLYSCTFKDVRLELLKLLQLRVLHKEDIDRGVPFDQAMVCNENTISRLSKRLKELTS